MTLWKPLTVAVAAASVLAFATPAPTRAQPAGPVQVVTNGPQANVERGSPSWSARQNVIESRRYDRLVETNRSFREARMRKECGPITDPQLHANCIASFNQDEPLMGAARRHS